MTQSTFPALTERHEATRATLHAYAHAVAAIPRAHGIAHPKWWHVGLKVRPEGLVTDPIPLPGGGMLAVRMDLRSHQVVVRTGGGGEERFDIAAGMPAAEMGEAIIGAASSFGLEGPYDRTRFDDTEPRAYDRSAATDYFDAFAAAAMVFERHRVTLGERVGPIQVWPHGFDLAFEWYGTKVREHDGEEMSSQLNLGLYPGGEAYFYSNPWPFDERLTGVPLPHGASWNTEGWQGAMLPYAAVQGDPAGAGRLADFATAVFEAAAPTLEAS